MTVLPVAYAVPPIASAEPLVGVWGAERVFADPLAGAFSIVEREGKLVASIAGRKAAVTRNGSSVQLNLPRGQGSYRGKFSKDEAQITGHWIQAAGTIEDYQFASPADLSRTADGVWSGTVNPFHEQLSLYLRINKEPDGQISVIMRNPERNIGLNYRLDHAAIRGDEVIFYGYDGTTVLTGTLHRAQASDTSADQSSDEIIGISVRLWYGETFDLTRRDRHNAPGFYPRPDLEQYRYVQPVPKDDGWPVANAASVGMRPEKIEAMVQGILDTEINSHRSPYIQDLMIARQGKLIVDEHFFGFHGDIAHDSRSAGKSITSMAVGAAAKLGKLSVRDKVYPLFPESAQNKDPRKASMTIEHLLTMSSGLACDDNDPDSPGNESNMQYQGSQTDWQLFTLNLPLVGEPGAKGLYCSGGIHLLTGVVSRKTDLWFPDFFRAHLAEPMNIRTYHMNLDPLQRGYGGGGLRLQPRDFLKFGQTMLDGGVWNGRRVLSKSWVRRSLTAQSSINTPNDYGYAWWRSEHEANGKRFESWSATGNGGQLIIIVPDYELTIAFNGGNYNNYPTWIAWRDELMPKLIAEAIR